MIYSKRNEDFIIFNCSNIMYTRIRIHHILKLSLSCTILFFLVSAGSIASGQVKPSGGIQTIPYPKEVRVSGPSLILTDGLTITIEGKHSPSDDFSAEELIRDLKDDFGISAVKGNRATGNCIVLTRKTGGKLPDEQAYRLCVTQGRVVISAKGEAGLFYGTRTLLQLIERNGNSFEIPGVEITDWPDIKQRAVHYDTKHHQDKASYVKSFIKDLARYKINMLIWEWEDKFAYPSHPEIGAPGAFTPAEMKDFTLFARRYHIQLVPLVQGLGHVSFILKWPQYIDLRENPSSNWEFCPLKDGSYRLLNDLWKDAADATSGSDYFHIGSDETYELGECDACRTKADETGKSGLYQLFVNRSAGYLKSLGRKVMAWETPMGWEHGDSPSKGIQPVSGLVMTESYEYETADFSCAKKARSLGFEVFAYDPNPGVVPLLVPYYFEKGEKKELRTGSLEKSHMFLCDASGSGIFDGMICTSWDDDDLHNQMWMMHFVNAASCSWNHDSPQPEKFTDLFFRDYYGISSNEPDELFRLLNEGVYYFTWTMERNVWHYGEIGQTHLPDLPRGDAVEYDPFWNTQYKDKLEESEAILKKMNRVIELTGSCSGKATRHSYDFEILRTSAELIRHTCLTYIDLSKLEYAIRDAHVSRFADNKKSLNYLIDAQFILENLLKRRNEVFTDLVSVYEKTRFPKGYSTADKQYFWQQDRARHFAFRRPDMSFLIYDEQLLDIEGYLQKLKAYTEYFRTSGMQ